MSEATSYDEHEQTPQDVKRERHQQLQATPEERAEAMRNAYAVLQLLRDQGILELIKGAVGSAEKVMGIVSGVIENERVVRTIRNLTILVKMIGTVEPETLEKIMSSLSDRMGGARTEKPPGLLWLIGQLSSGDSRRALEPVAAVLQALGRNMPETKTEGTKTTNA